MSIEWLRIRDAERVTIEGLQADAPVKVSEVARTLGLTVKAATLAPGISGEIRPDPEHTGSFVIRVNRHDASRRQRFTVAHEIGHFLLHREQIGGGISDDVLYRSSLSDQREAEANRMAADILMPTALVARYMSEARATGVEDVASYLADKFEVSLAAMKIRLGL